MEMRAWIKVFATKPVYAYIIAKSSSMRINQLKYLIKFNFYD